MNILGIGVAELAIIFIILMVVAGPKRMITWAYIAGRELARLRAMWSETMEVIQEELKEAGLEDINELNKIRKDIGKINLGEEVRRAMEPSKPGTAQQAAEREASKAKPAASKPAARGAPALASKPRSSEQSPPHPEAQPVDAGVAEPHDEADGRGAGAANAAPPDDGTETRKESPSSNGH